MLVNVLQFGVANELADDDIDADRDHLVFFCCVHALSFSSLACNLLVGLFVSICFASISQNRQKLTGLCFHLALRLSMQHSKCMLHATATAITFACIMVLCQCFQVMCLVQQILMR